MRKLLFILLIPVLGIGQKLGADVIKFDSITSTVRDSYTVPYGETWLIWNGTTEQFEYTDGSNSWSALGGGSGDVVGPASSTDNTIARFDGTTGKIIQGSGITIDDTDNVNGINVLNFFSGSVSDQLETSSLVNDYLFQNPTDTAPGGSEGAYYADDSENRPKYYDGTSWKSFILDGDVTGGTDDQTASEVSIADSGGNFTATDVEGALAELASASGSAEYRNPEVLYVSRASGDVTNQWADSTGLEERKIVNYCPTGDCYYNIPSGFTSLKSVRVSPIVSVGANMIFTSDNYTIRGNGTNYVSIGPNPASGFVGVYVDSANTVDFNRNNILTSHAFFNGYFKPYSISQVSNVASSNIAETSFDISWDAATASVGTISDYEYSIDSGTPVSVTGATTATVSGLTADTAYNVNVRAVDDGGNKGQYSADLSVTTSGGVTNYYTLANAANPDSEVDATTGFVVASGSATISSVESSPTAQDGSSSILLTNTGGGETRVQAVLGDIGNGDTFDISMYVQVMSGSNSDFNIQLSTVEGWVSGNSATPTGSGWSLVTFTGETTNDTDVRIRFRLLNGVSESIAIDNIVITVN